LSGSGPSSSLVWDYPQMGYLASMPEKRFKITRVYRDGSFEQEPELTDLGAEEAKTQIQGLYDVVDLGQQEWYVWII
jgi:hypothetical protein